jgi:hypothetical protein
MTTTTAQPALNIAQIHFLQMLQHIKTEQKLNELKRIVSDFYFNQLEGETDKWWNENNMTDEKLEAKIQSNSYKLHQ